MRWLPFQLNPDLPPAGISRADYIARKWGPGKAASDIYSRVSGVGRQVGIAFAFDKITVQPNTLEAHRLLLYAEKQGRQDALSEELFKAYFIEGGNLTDRDTLVDVGARAGLDAEALRAYLESDQDREVVLRADVEARQAGIGGVPFFIFNRKVGVSGAQEAHTLLEAMEEAAK